MRGSRGRGAACYASSLYSRAGDRQALRGRQPCALPAPEGLDPRAGRGARAAAIGAGIGTIELLSGSRSRSREPLFLARRDARAPGRRGRALGERRRSRTPSSPASPAATASCSRRTPRAQLWVGELDGAGMLVLDEHDLIYAYGPLAPLRAGAPGAGLRARRPAGAGAARAPLRPQFDELETDCGALGVEPHPAPGQASRRTETPRARAGSRPRSRACSRRGRARRRDEGRPRSARSSRRAAAGSRPRRARAAARTRPSRVLIVDVPQSVPCVSACSLPRRRTLPSKVALRRHRAYASSAGVRASRKSSATPTPVQRARRAGAAARAPSPRARSARPLPRRRFRRAGGAGPARPRGRSARRPQRLVALAVEASAEALEARLDALDRRSEMCVDALGEHAFGLADEPLDGEVELAAEPPRSVLARRADRRVELLRGGLGVARGLARDGAAELLELPVLDVARAGSRHAGSPRPARGRSAPAARARGAGAGRRAPAAPCAARSRAARVGRRRLAPPPAPCGRARRAACASGRDAPRPPPAALSASASIRASIWFVSCTCRCASRAISAARLSWSWLRSPLQSVSRSSTRAARRQRLGRAWRRRRARARRRRRGAPR